MTYSFQLLGISPVIQLFQSQQQAIQSRPDLEYVGVHHCTLDAFVDSVETVALSKGWEAMPVVSTVIEFWVNNPQKIHYWAQRLQSAGHENLLMARIGKLEALKSRFDHLFTVGQ
ncbi:hypothetical protein [Synechococcus sp. PCC 6312]|uniref:hypothetical protein n=1 Tax=Synechococcus sp. (strain ATCC 27167 / PCC 6312) TaxID=195253 RepID=UPI00029EDDBF|nr:hypothetical protein [Synechococcus sp. PCC 6312]AFY60275.1 hypothetical protein Syn6312_1083 [Synechococcus sp. PCC 6312]